MLCMNLTETNLCIALAPYYLVKSHPCLVSPILLGRICQVTAIHHFVELALQTNTLMVKYLVAFFTHCLWMFSPITLMRKMNQFLCNNKCHVPIQTIIFQGYPCWLDMLLEVELYCNKSVRGSLIDLWYPEGTLSFFQKEFTWEHSRRTWFRDSNWVFLYFLILDAWTYL